MTDRIDSLVVVLDQDIREDDIGPTIEAIKMIKGVLSVDAHVRDVATHIAEKRVKHEIGKEVYEFFNEKFWR